MKLNRKGFTLVELLVTIVIAGLVIGFSTWGIINVVNNSKEQTVVLSENSLKEAARIYSAEASSDSWKKQENYDAFCVTVGELINKGLLDKNASFSNDITKDNYILVKRNKITLAIEKEEIVPDVIGDEYNEICTLQHKNDLEEIIGKPVITEYESYTDRIEITFSDGNATSGVKDYKCLYGESSSNVNKEGVVEGNKCILDGLKNNKDYYALIYMNTNSGSSILADGTKDYKTKDFEDVYFNQGADLLHIVFDDSNIYGNSYHYFKSDVASRYLLNNVKKCDANGNNFVCSELTNDLEKDVWYSSDDLIQYNIIEYLDDGEINATARICDKSNNCKDFSISFEIKKYTVKFYKNGVLSIDGKGDEYVEKSCIADIIDGSGSCTVTSPSIEPNIGYSTVGWNTSSTSTSSSLDVGVSKDISSDMEYYAITRRNKVTIQYNSNGGTIESNFYYKPDNDYFYFYAGYWDINDEGMLLSSSSATTPYTETIYYDDIFNKYDLNAGLIDADSDWITKNGNTVIKGKEWRCLSGSCIYETYDQDIADYKSSDFCDASVNDCAITLGVNWNSSYYIDLNWKIDGKLNYTNPHSNDLKARLIIGDDDKGYISDYYTEHSSGTTWKIDGLELNGTYVSYTASGVVGDGISSINIDVNTLSISVNDSNYGGVSTEKVFVKPNTKYSTNSNVLTLGDGRKVTANTKKVIGYTTSFTGWSSTSGTINSKTDVTANFDGRINKVYIKYSPNGGTLQSGSNAGGTWETQIETINNKTFTVVSNIPKDGTGKTTNLDVLDYGTAFIKNGLLNYNNSDYLKITKSGYTAYTGSAWVCLSDNCKDKIYSQKTNYSASDFCDASNGDCTVVLGVKWRKQSSTSTSTTKYYCVYGGASPSDCDIFAGYINIKNIKDPSGLPSDYDCGVYNHEYDETKQTMLYLYKCVKK